MSYSIENFWKIKLADVTAPGKVALLPGWLTNSKTNPSFVQADLTLRNEFENLDAPVWFIAAPGAVGKSTLAKEVAAQTGAIYLDLATADSVAGNYLTGGLVKNHLFAQWQANTATILIDALDEARLRVTQRSFEDFLDDVRNLSSGRPVPTILFGRVGIIEEAWLVLSDQGLECPIFDIGFFSPPKAKQFILATLEKLAAKPGNEPLATSLEAHRAVYSQAAERFVTGLDKTAASDGSKFAGYAPVLEAVATALASVLNPVRLDASVEDAMQGKILQQLTDQILTREAGKLRSQLPPDISDEIRIRLYAPDEQLSRLCSIVYQIPSLLPNVELETRFSSAYDSAVAGFLPNHPFLDGSGRLPSGAVFAAAINAHALLSSSPNLVAAAEKEAGVGPHTPNPFLVDFYLDRARTKSGNVAIIPPEHVVALYDSIRARSSAGEVTRLSIEGDDENDIADVEIQISGSGRQEVDRRLLLQTSQAGELRFGRQVTGTNIDAPQLDVIIGSGNSVELVAPVFLNVGRLTLNCSDLAVIRGDQSEAGDASVSIEAKELKSNRLVGVPSVRKGCEFAVFWPGSSIYPWSQFTIPQDKTVGADLDEALRALRRLVMAFRSHSKGQLARYQDKIEHARMTKGDLGIALRERMMRDGILSLQGEMYILDPSELGRIVGVSYHDIKLRRFGDKARRYLVSVMTD